MNGNVIVRIVHTYIAMRYARKFLDKIYNEILGEDK